MKRAANRRVYKGTFKRERLLEQEIQLVSFV